jgi:exopolysaccharide biosynthesis polyprenyl glycosylphosphotransferase
MISELRDEAPELFGIPAEVAGRPLSVAGSYIGLDPDFGYGRGPAGGAGAVVLPFPSARSRVASPRGKRALDLVLATVLLIVSFPFLVLIALAVGLTSRGPALFRQDRVGRGGELFTILKFRTMKTNDDSDHTWAVAHDPRVTRVGRLLRRTSLDELPQLLNVIKGDMSLIGPRPERPFFVEEFKERVASYSYRFRMLPGITGWAQVHGLRGDTSIDDRIQYDIYYIEHRTLLLDLRILARTVGHVLTIAGR